MQLTFLGHAGFLLEHNNILVIMDPWLSSRGAYDSAWLQFPCNHHLSPFVLNKLKDFEHIYVYLSHEHKDHFDSEFLQKILQTRADVIFLIPNFKSKFFLDELKHLKPPKIIELANEEIYRAQEMDICLFIDESGINHDSGILVSAGGYKFLNLNDCKIFDRLTYIKNKFKSIDIFSVQFSGASWHPVCYEMSEQEYKLISKKKKLSKYRAVLNALKILQPRRYLPAAGPPALLDPMHYQINFQNDTIFPHQLDIVNFLSTFGLSCLIDKIMPGDVYCFQTDQYLTLASERISEENFKSYMEEYGKKTKNLFEENSRYHPENLSELFVAYFNYILAKAEKFFIKEKISHCLYFAINEVKDKFIQLDLNTRICVITEFVQKENYFLVAYPAWQIRKLIEGKIKGEDLSLTFRGRMKRSPDIYDTWVSCFLNSEVENLSENIKLIEAIKENNEKIIVECNGVRYKIRRFCPHQGAELQYGWCEDHYWVCPKHRWHYDLKNSGICASTNISIDAVKLSEEKDTVKLTD